MTYTSRNLPRSRYSLVSVTDRAAKFAPGQLIQHRLFGYRGVITDLDPSFSASEEWYEQVAQSRPPKDQPWYHVLVHDSDQTTYVAERNLAPDESAEPVRHPLLDDFFGGFSGGRYRRREALN